MSRLKDAREQAGLTQQEVAKRIGIHTNTLIRLEQGTLANTVRIVEEMSLIYGKSKYWIMGWSEDDRPRVQKTKVVGYDDKIAELERENAYLQRRLQSLEYRMTLHSWTWGGKQNG